MDFKDKHGKKIECKISYIPIWLCELGYAIERVLARTHSGIKGFLLKKEQPQQLTLAECFAGLGFK